MQKFVVCLVVFLFISHAAVADYILTSGSNDTGANGGQSIIRYKDNFQVVWERSPALGTAETTVFAVEISPLNGDVYTTQIASPQLGKHLNYVDGTYIGRPIPAGGQTDGTGTYTAPAEAVQDIQFGYDYNKDGVDDLWVCRRDTFEVYDGTTLNRTGDNGTADLLTWLKIADSGGTSGVQDGTGGFGITFGPDLTGDGIGELYAMAVVNAATGSRLNVWNPVTMTKVATYNIDGTRDNALIILGPDVNKDGKQDLWITDPRNHRIRAYDYATGALVAGSISLVKASEPATAVTLRFPTDVDFGPNGTIVITTRFATSLDPQWTGPSDTAGGDLLQIQWDPISGKGLTTLLFEYPRRLDSVAYIAPELKRAVEPYPANSATDVSRDVIFSWTSGKYANKHDVYLGTNFKNVNDASRTNPLGVLASFNQDANTYDPGRLDFSQTYYWRVDEVNAPPDSTIFKGNIWQFTVEPIAYPIAGASITATASSSNSANEGSRNTINNSGLDSHDLHSAENRDMWLSSIIGPQPTWIQYELDKVYKLHQMWVWNHNSMLELSFGLGIKNATIEYSLDGANWTTLGTTHEFGRAPGAVGYAYNITVDLGGAVAKYVKITANSNWGGMVPQYGLSEVRFFYIPVLAREPQPASGVKDVSVDNVTLSWRAGRQAAAHHVYLSPDQQAVINETTSPVSVPAGSSYASYDTGPLDLGKTYYWKVNEVNEAETPTTWHGDIWNFRTQEYLVVDDFEDYNDFEPDRIFDTWIDGYLDPANGSQLGRPEDPLNAPFTEQTIRHSGKQSMSFIYDNSTVDYSEVTANVANLPISQDWTKHGIKGMTLYFYGDPCNVTQKMYVKLNSSKFIYDGQADDLKRIPWQMWYIDLANLSADRSYVTQLSIGFERSGGLGGKGVVYFDDIRLTPFDRQLVTPAEPSQAGLVARYEFEGNTNDSVGAKNGTVQSNPTYVAGKVGQAIYLDGVDDYVFVDGAYQLPVYSVAVWFRVVGGTGNRDIFSSYEAGGGHGILLELRSNGVLRYLHRFPFSTSGGTDIYTDTTYDDGTWHHVVMVKSADTMTLYVNGLQAGLAANNTQFDVTPLIVTLGVLRHNSLSRYFPGAIDDVRIYDRVLTQEEVAWLAGRTKPFDKPF